MDMEISARANGVFEWMLSSAAASLTLAAMWIVALVLLGPSAYVTPLALLGVVAAASVVASAARGNHWALGGLLALCLVAPNIYYQYAPPPREAAFETAAGTTSAQNALRLILWGAMGVVACARWRQIAPLLKDDLIWPFAALGVIALASTLWSPVPAYTAAAALGFLSTLFFACVVAADLPPKSVFRIVFGSMALYFVITWGAVAIAPDLAWVAPWEEGHPYRLIGMSSHPNALAKDTASLICLAMALAIVHGRKSLGILAAVVGLIIIFEAESRTSLIALAVALLAAVATRRSLRFAAICSTCLLALALFLWSSGAAPDLNTILGGAGRDSNDSSEVLTLTGRTELWGLVWDKIEQSPILGYGFDAAEATLSKDWWGEPESQRAAHNIWLQAMLILGIPGVALLVFWQTRLLRRWFVDRESATRFLAPYVLVVGLTEAEIVTHPILPTLILFLAISLDARRLLNAELVQ